jgi:formylglycine-generating enzyme required for sulfatase activity
VSSASNEVAAKPASHAQIRIREPAGERALGEGLTLGGEGAAVVVPGSLGVALTFERRDAQWLAIPAAAGVVRVNGRAVGSPRELRRNDTLSVGEAQVVVLDASRTLLRLEVHHLVGNDTIAPVGEVATLAADAGDEDLEIRASTPLRVSAPTRVGTSTPALDSATQPARIRNARGWLTGLVVAVALFAILLTGLALEPITLDLSPEDAQVSTPGTWVSLRTAGKVRVFPGTHVIRAEREGYVPAQANVVVRDDGVAPPLKLRLARLPGRLDIDTGGVPVEVGVDGVVLGKAPGEVRIPAGRRTLTLRSPRHLDYVATIEIEGADVRQELEAKLQPSWGTLQVTAIPAGARVSVDGVARGAAPAALETPSGVRTVRIEAPGFKAWQSTVVLKAGETLPVGPVTLGQPDARLSLRSRPVGAEVSVGGTYRGRTPLVVELPAGVAHQVVATLPGHASWSRSVFAESGKELELLAALEAVTARVTIRGEPSGAELLVDGAARGQTPQTLELGAIEHRIEVRKAGYETFVTAITPARGLERDVEYRLMPTDRAAALLETAPVVKTQTGYELRLIPGGEFVMGSDRREQGRRPNESQRRVTLARPFYLGTREVTNAEFRRYRPGHASGFLGKLSLDLDDQAVSQVTWNDAAEYCNWLSEREGLPPVYERRGEKYWLKRPVTAGYRLPTEAEWEYAARRSPTGLMLRYPWGDTLPVAADTGNLAGAEAQKIVEGALPGYQDDYVVVAPVGKFAPNALGLHDMGGNVSEWMNDFYLSFVDTKEATDPLGPEQAGQHVVRGANWRTLVAADLRLAWRDSGGDEVSPTIGFRVARYAE